MFRFGRWIAVLAVFVALVPVVSLGLQIVRDDWAFRRADITDELVRRGRYDPAEQFSFERACTHSVGEHGDSDLQTRGYTRVDPTTAQDPDMYWPLVLINDTAKTYRILYGREVEVMAPGWVCNARITLMIETADGRARAYVAEARSH
ncbi:MAG: hypothetical protein WA418_18725 [Bradyrhizobium sp.]